MNKRIRSMIDGNFAQMLMTAENLALRDELLSNALSRYADAMAQGKSEEEAIGEIAASLEDMGELLAQMSADKDAQKDESAAGEEPEKQAAAPQSDLSDALNKAFGALGDFSQAIMPEAKKLYGQMDEATGGVLGKLGRAAKKGMRDAQKAAGEAIDKLSREKGELIFDFGAGREAKPEEPEVFVSDFGDVTSPKMEEEKETDGELVLDMDAIRREQEAAQEETDKLRIDALEKEAQALCAQAAIKEVTGDEAGAQELRQQAQELRMQAALLAGKAEETAVDYVMQDGEIDEAAFARVVDDLTRDAQEAIRRADEDRAQ